ncbi:MAG: hypothetical protein LBQ47_06455 [Endomicrobium sp.]|jgi:hypothetical protein|nr:hypothetical protein [Endomicrobium sp.]
MMKKLFLFFIAVSALITGCDRNPMSSFLYPDVSESVDWTQEWMLYDDTLKTRGSFDFPTFTDYWATRKAELNLEYKKNPHSGSKCMYINWDGSESHPYDPNNGSLQPLQNSYVGFSIPSASPQSGIYIPAGTYFKMKFYVKGKLAYGVVLEVKGPQSPTGYSYGEVYESAEGAEFSDWQEITIDISPAAMLPVGNLFSVALVNKRATLSSNGGTIYLDDIRYTK